MNEQMKEQVEVINDFIENLKAVKGKEFADGVSGVVAITTLLEMSLDREVPPPLMKMLAMPQASTAIAILLKALGLADVAPEVLAHAKAMNQIMESAAARMSGGSHGSGK